MLKVVSILISLVSALKISPLNGKRPKEIEYERKYMDAISDKDVWSTLQTNYSSKAGSVHLITAEFYD